MPPSPCPINYHAPFLLWCDVFEASSSHIPTSTELSPSNHASTAPIPADSQTEPLCRHCLNTHQLTRILPMPLCFHVPSDSIARMRQNRPGLGGSLRLQRTNVRLAAEHNALRVAIRTTRISELDALTTHTMHALGVTCGSQDSRRLLYSTANACKATSNT